MIFRPRSAPSAQGRDALLTNPKLWQILPEHFDREAQRTAALRPLYTGRSAAVRCASRSKCSGRICQSFGFVSRASRPCALGAERGLNIIVWIGHFIIRGPVANLQKNG